MLEEQSERRENSTTGEPDRGILHFPRSREVCVQEDDVERITNLRFMSLASS